jgi:hypothetical protein
MKIIMRLALIAGIAEIRSRLFEPLVTAGKKES